MAKVWSFNTTVRNPERMENMLRALSELEGEVFDAKGQEDFFGLQIKKRLYKPEKRTLEDENLMQAVHFDESGDDISDEIVERILEKYRGRDVDGSGRGRTAAGIINRFGLSVALQSKGNVVITNTAKKWLEHGIDDDEMFTKFFLKWQYPNHIESGYDDFNIKPFVGTLALIAKVNKKWKELGEKPVGLSKTEYQLFVPSLTKADQIEEYANRIIEFRSVKLEKKGTEKAQFIKNFSLSRVSEIYGDKNPEKALRDLKDYTDSSIRYFRVSGLVALRGSDTHVDIAHDKEVEVASILETITPTAEEFDTYEKYFEYLNDLEALELPWVNEEDLGKISLKLEEILQEEDSESALEQYLVEIQNLSTKSKVENLEAKLNELRIKKLKSLRHNISVLDECILRLQGIASKGYETLTARPSLDFEWYVTRSLMVLNDAVDITPSFKVGDDGIPTGFKGNASDIECEYESFGMTVEVTLLLGRDQWYAEGQPVMRHLRDFEERIDQDSTYCIFVAPIIHRDTLNTFWGSNIAGYEGVKQSIIPLTLKQFVCFLQKAKTKIEQESLMHTDIKKLLNNFVEKSESVQSPHDWVLSFDEVINDWSQED